MLPLSKNRAEAELGRPEPVVLSRTHVRRSEGHQHVLGDDDTVDVNHRTPAWVIATWLHSPIGTGSGECSSSFSPSTEMTSEGPGPAERPMSKRVTRAAGSSSEDVQQDPGQIVPEVEDLAEWFDLRRTIPRR